MSATVPMAGHGPQPESGTRAPVSRVRLRPWRRLALGLVLAGFGMAAAARTGETAPGPVARSDMSVGQAVVLGVVEGLTEYLPVSSTGHLLLTQRLMGIGQTGESREAADAYAICIQAGAILAVAGLYFGFLRRMALGVLGRDAAGLRLTVNLGAAFVPAAIAGLLLEKTIKERLFGGGAMGLWPVAGAWIAGGIVILAVDGWVKSRRQSGRGLGMEQLTWRLAIGIGLVQCLAMWPGVSRSLATILGGLAVGLSLGAAVEFSFLLGLVTLSASTAVDALKHGAAMLHAYGALTAVVGLVAAFVSAAAAVTWMVRYLQRHPLAVFGWYRILLGAGVSAWLIAGR